MLVNPQAHKDILLRILKDIYKDSSLGPLLGFKGGTAAMLFYHLPRFSVDLDFDLLDTTRQDNVLDSMRLILEKYGVVREAKVKKSHICLVLSYDEQSQNIKVDINMRRFSSVYEMKSYLGIPMLVMVRPDMLAHKLMAMMERLGQTNRDLFDVWFFLKERWEVNSFIIEQRSGKSYRDFIAGCIAAIESLHIKHILSGMGELLDSSQKTWVKAHLIEDIVFLLKLELEKISS